MFSRKITDYAVLGFKLSEERLYQKITVCVRSISMLIASNTRRDFRMSSSCLDCALGSENLNLRLFPRSFHVHKPARSVHAVTFGFLYTSGVSCHCVCARVATSCVLTNLLSLSLLGASTTIWTFQTWSRTKYRSCN